MKGRDLTISSPVRVKPDRPLAPPSQDRPSADAGGTGRARLGLRYGAGR